jgi:hypothetical protein
MSTTETIHLRCSNCCYKEVRSYKEHDERERLGYVPLEILQKRKEFFFSKYLEVDNQIRDTTLNKHIKLSDFCDIPDHPLSKTKRKEKPWDEVKLKV